MTMVASFQILSKFAIKKNIHGYLLTIDFQKAFDSLNHCFLLSVLCKYGFGEDFVDWVKIALKDSEPCVINGK